MSPQAEETRGTPPSTATCSMASSYRDDLDAPIQEHKEELDAAEWLMRKPSSLSFGNDDDKENEPTLSPTPSTKEEPADEKPTTPSTASSATISERIALEEPRHATVGEEGKHPVVETTVDAEQWLTRGLEEAKSATTEDEERQPVAETEDAEQWLTRRLEEAKSPTAATKEEAGKPVVETVDAEQWLTRGRPEVMLQSWRREQQEHEAHVLEHPHDLNHDRYSMLEARSSVSSPGKCSLRDKLEHRIRKRQEHITDHHSRLSDMPESSVMMQDQSLDDFMLGGWSDDEDDIPPTSPTSDSGLDMPEDPHNARRKVLQAVSSDEASTMSLYRLSRTVRYGRRGEMPTGHANVVRLHVYDLLQNNTIMILPFGCEFPIGKCFHAMNNGLHALGTGAYHCGLEVNGIEYGYGANDIAESTGVFTCVPKRSPGYEYRATIDFGSRVARRTSWINVETKLVNTKTGKGTKVSDVYKEVENSVDGKTILKQMAGEYRGTDYDLLNRNCCTFAKDACLRLGVKEEEVPTWFMNLAHVGAEARDATNCFALPQQQKITVQQTPAMPQGDDDAEGGFEVILEDEVQTVIVVDAATVEEEPGLSSIGVRRTTSWTY